MAQSTLSVPETSMPQAGQVNQSRMPAIGSPSGTTVVLQQPDRTAEQESLQRPSARVVGPLTTKSEFQQFAEDAAGRLLPVYGRQLFDEVPTTFAPTDQIPIPADYVIGPGDEVLIRIWGKIDLDARVIVDRNGQISLPRIGTLSVAGLHFDQLENRIRSAVSVLYRDFEIRVSMGRLRSIQIYVLGNARQPGAYTVSSLSTLVNALFTSGGPSATGSMRRIQLRRGNETVTELDIYDLLRNGDKSRDRQLLPGDIIYIPPAGPQIAIFGSVNEPGIYELNGDTSVDSALRAAGGITALAETEKVLVERVEDHRTRRADEFALDGTGLQRRVLNGDLLRILPLSPQFENSVTLRGNVAQPGRYPWHDGMHVSDLIPTRDVLISRDYWNQLNHNMPTEPPNPFAAPATNRFRNQIAVGAQMESEFRSSDISNGRQERAENRTGNPQVTQLNAYPQPGQSSQSFNNQFGQQGTQLQPNVQNQSNLQIEEEDTPTVAAIGKISAEINWEYAVIERLDERDLSTHLIPFRLASAIDDHASADNQVLRSGDIVTIFSRADLDLPMEKHASFVRVGGEVNAPGVYRVNPGDTLQDVVRMAGGLTPHSYLYASKFTRLSTRRTEEEQLRQSSEQMQKELMSRYANALLAPGQNASEQQTQLALQQAAIARLSGPRPTGRVVLQMRPSAATVQDIPDLPLEDGDALYIPPQLSTVQVTGQVYNSNAFRYQPGRRLTDYLNDAGGPTREADKRRVFVIRADGTVISKQSTSLHQKFENLKLLPGDAIVVPERIKTPGSFRLQDLTQIISQSALTGAALNTVIP